MAQNKHFCYKYGMRPKQVQNPARQRLNSIILSCICCSMGLGMSSPMVLLVVMASLLGLLCSFLAAFPQMINISGLPIFLDCPLNLGFTFTASQITLQEYTAWLPCPFSGILVEDFLIPQHLHALETSTHGWCQCLLQAEAVVRLSSLLALRIEGLDC